MLERNNPEIDVDVLMDRVQQEVLRRQFGDPAASPGTAAFEASIAAAAERGGVRTRWPARLRFFPFNLPSVQRFGLRVLVWLFRDQQAFNGAVVQALRESVALNARLQGSLRDLEERIAQLEGRD